MHNTTFYIAHQGGIYANDSTTPVVAGNVRAIKTFGCIAYVSMASSIVTAIQVNTFSGTGITCLPGFTNNAKIQDYYLVQSGTNGTAYDILYVLFTTSNTVGSIAKYSFVNNSLVATGRLHIVWWVWACNTANRKQYLPICLHRQGTLPANSVVRLTDEAGYNAAISINAANNITLYTAASVTTIKGVAFAPDAPLSVVCLSPSCKNKTARISLCGKPAMKIKAKSLS